MVRRLPIENLTFHVTVDLRQAIYHRGSFPLVLRTSKIQLAKTRPDFAKITCNHPYGIILTVESKTP